MENKKNILFASNLIHIKIFIQEREREWRKKERKKEKMRIK